MHPNSTYRHQSDAQALHLAAARGFGVVTAQLDDLFGAHVPFLIEGGTAHLHLNRANPLAAGQSQRKGKAGIDARHSTLCPSY